MNWKRNSGRGGHRLPRGRSGSLRPARQWLAMDATISTASGGGAAVTNLLEFQAPTITAGTALTSDPPEDQVLDRIIFRLSFTSNATMRLAYGLILVDRTWTPSGTTSILADLDKRFLWWRDLFYTAAEEYDATSFKSAAGTKYPAGWADSVTPCFCDISPKVRIEDGKSLALVTYTSAANTTTMTMQDLRILMHRAGRR